MYQDTYKVPGLPVTINHVVNMDYDGNGSAAFSAEVIYEGEGWVGFGISPTGAMVGSTAIIGLPDGGDNLAANPGKYSLAARSLDLVTLMENQTLLESSIEQTLTHTIMTFVKLLEEDGEIAIDPMGDNNFLVAFGYFNELAYHEDRASFQLSLNPCYPYSTDLILNMTNMTNATIYNETLAPSDWDGALITAGGGADTGAGFDINGNDIAIARHSGQQEPSSAVKSGGISFAQISLFAIAPFVAVLS